MRHIDLSKLDSDEQPLKNWNEKANQHYNEIKKLQTHKERADYLKKHPIWSELKDLLITTYGQICWYSECDLSGGFGDVDHFRPKNVSKNLDGTPILTDGYWWLAYDWLNYRLSCAVCNRSGKKDYFPLRDTRKALTIGDSISNEEYKLIDPCSSSDVRLIGYDQAGQVMALTSKPYEKSRVEVSKSLYKLAEFNVARKRVSGDCQLLITTFDFAYNMDNRNLIRLTLEQMHSRLSKGTPYASVSYNYICDLVIGRPYEKELIDCLNKWMSN